MFALWAFTGSMFKWYDCSASDRWWRFSFNYRGVYTLKKMPDNKIKAIQTMEKIYGDFVNLVDKIAQQ